jgi:hypothetical protein
MSAGARAEAHFRAHRASIARPWAAPLVRGTRPNRATHGPLETCAPWQPHCLVSAQEGNDMALAKLLVMALVAIVIAVASAWMHPSDAGTLQFRRPTPLFLAR